MDHLEVVFKFNNLFICRRKVCGSDLDMWEEWVVKGSQMCVYGGKRGSRERTRPKR